MAYALRGVGADAPAAAPATTLHEAVTSDFVKTAAGLTLTWHGYKRTGSLVWALVYGLAGRLLPTVAVPVAIAQGIGTKKGCP